MTAMVLLASMGVAEPSAAETSVIPLAAWQHPPPEARPGARWWWPGASVDPPALRRQLEQIRAAGFGAVEVQPLLLGLGSDDLAADARLRGVGQPLFRSAISAAAKAAAELGLAFDFTLSSGWPGGLPTARINGERQLLMAVQDVAGPTQFRDALPPPPDQSYRTVVEFALDVLGPPDPEVALIAVLAARIGAEREGVPTLEEVQLITSAAKPRDLPGQAAREWQLDWSVPPGDWRIFAFYENSTMHFVMGGAFPGAEADALVVDHLSRRGADALLDEYAAPALAGLPSGHVRHVFVDSFELMGELPFTGEFLTAFREQTGYALTPHLPLLFRKGGESKYGEMVDFFGRNGGPLYLAPEPLRAERIREDYEAVRATLFEQEFVGRVAQWAHRRGLSLRLQAHGGYGNTLDQYARADVPESEGLFAAGSFDFLKLAASAAHVAGRRWASCEAFITMRLFSRRLSEEEMRLLAGRAYSAGINRLVYHGVPYPYERADGETWFPFSGGFGRILAGPFPMSSQVDADFLAELPDFNRFLARLSVAMSHGEPVADLAWLRSDPSYPDSASLQIGRIKAHAGESETTRALRARALVHDRVSPRMLAAARVGSDELVIGKQEYRALLLDPLEIAEPELAESIAAIAEAGIPVLALGALPSRAPGLRDAASRDQRVRAAMKRLATRVVRVAEPDRLEEMLAKHVRAGLVEPPAGARLSVSLERRRSDVGDTLLVFNEAWSPHKARMRFVVSGGALTLWDPRSGTRRVLHAQVEAGQIVELELAAAESLILTLALAE